MANDKLIFFHYRSPVDALAGSSNWHCAICRERMDAWAAAAQKKSAWASARGSHHAWMHADAFCILSMYACNEQDMSFSNLIVACNLVVDGNVPRSRSASTCHHTGRSMAKPICPTTRHEIHQRSQTGYGMHDRFFSDVSLLDQI